jgi:hypothetical protein
LSDTCRIDCPGRGEANPSTAVKPSGNRRDR